LEDEENREDTDSVADHPEHEKSHENLHLGAGCHFHKFLNH